MHFRLERVKLNRRVTQKQPFADVFQNRCSQKLCNINNKIYQKETQTQVNSCEYWNIFSNSFSTDHLRWLVLCAAINRRYSEKYLLQNFNDYKLRNSVSVDVPCKRNRPRVFSTEFCKFLEQLLSSIIFLGGAVSEKKKEEEKGAQ